MMAAGCEFSFDVDVKADPGLYLQCMADGEGNQISLRLQYAAPAKSSGEEIPTLDVRRLEVTVDGQTQAVEDRGDGLYTVDCKEPMKAEQVVKVVAEAEGLKPVEANTVLVGDIGLKSLEVEKDKMMILELHNLTIELEDEPREGEYIAIRILRLDWENERDAISECLRPMIVSTDSEVETAQVSLVGRMIDESGRSDNHITILPARAFKEGKITLPLAILPQRPGIEDEEKPDYAKSEYDVTAYRVSESFFRYSLAVYKSKSDFMAIMGLAPANFAWSNIKNGFGVCASICGGSSLTCPVPEK